MQLSAISRLIRPALAGLSAARHGAVLFVALLVGLLLTNHFLWDDDPNRCQTLARGGKYVENHWIPDGCTTIQHGGHEMNSCTHGQKRKIVFAGDSSLQEIFWVMATRLDKSINIPALEPKDLQFSKDNIELEFYWDEWLNGTRLVLALENLRNGRPSRPMLTIVGGGKSFVAANDLDGYSAAVAGLADIAYSDKFPREPVGSNRVFSAQDGPGDLLLFTPALFTRPERFAAGDDLSAFVEVDARLANLQKVIPHISVLWSFIEMLENSGSRHGIANPQADTVLNMRCNANVWHWPPNLGVCCGIWRSPNWIQSLFLLSSFLVLPALVAMDMATPLLSPTSRTFVRGLAAFSAAISLQYITDRTHIFEHVVKFGWYTPKVMKMLGVAFLFGIISLRRCRPVSSASTGGKAPDQPFMPRDQTDEWKGWMQLAIIIYHYNKAWEATWFWEIIRMSVSSYLFLTGFGHTLYHLQKKDFSLKRFVNVMVRTNLLPCTLAYVMNTRWLLYYYMPLSTFWFAVTFATLAIGQKYNDNTWALLAKIFVSIISVEALLFTKDLTDTVVKLFKITCRISFDADEFFAHRVAQDRYIVYVGMLAAMFYLWIKDVLSSNKRQDSISRAARAFFTPLKYFTVALSAVAFVWFWWYLQTGVPSQNAFTQLQPFVSFIPILSFIVLRNAHPMLRNWHSAAFAWLGRYSAEMYVMQDHIWLAGDQEGILRTGFFHGDESVVYDRWRDLVLITPLYLIACSIIGDATGVIATWFLQEREAGSNTHAVPEVEIGLLSGSGDDDSADEKLTSRRMFWQRITLPWPALEWRVFWVLAGMWFLNWTYT